MRIVRNFIQKKLISKHHFSANIHTISEKNNNFLIKQE